MKMTAPLNDNWLFCDGFDPECLEASYDWTGSYIVSVPHCASEIDKNYFDEKTLERVSTYTRSFFVPSSYTGSRIILRFEGVLSYAEVYVNGIFVTSHKGETAFEADITAPVVYDLDN